VSVSFKMWGRKDKQKRGERRKGGGASKGGAGLPFMGLGVPPGAEESKEALEAELLALQGKSPVAGKGKKGSKVMSLNEIDSMVAGLDDVGESDEDEEEEEGGEEEDDSDLLAELQEIANEDEEEAPPTAPPTATPTKPATTTKTPVQSSQLTEVSERMAMYEKAIAEAKGKGESSKARRYTRALDTIKTLQRKAQSGKDVSIDDLPPPVALSGGGGDGPKTATTVPQPTTEITDDDLMAWANSSSDPSPPAPAPKPRPVTQNTPPRPKPRPSKETTPTQQRPHPKAPPTTSDGRIDLNAPEFDESDEDMAMLAAQMDSHKASVKTETQPPPPRPKPRQQTTPPQAKPRPKAPPPTTSDGRIDLDAPEFDEFNLSDEDMAMLAAQMGDDSAKKQKLDSPAKPSTLPAPSQSLPVPLTPRGAPTRENVREVLGERRDQYSAAMKQAKTRNNTGKARECGKMAATFSKVLKAFDQGQQVDLSNVPPPPPGYTSRFTFDLSRYKPPNTEQAPQPSQVVTETPQGSVATATSQEEREQGEESDPSIPVPRTVMEALEQRLAKYEDTQRATQEKGETSRVRRMGRIVKQYQEAIRMTKAKKPYDYSELPDPPGYPPIPVPRSPTSLPPSLPKPTQSLPPIGSKFMPNPTVSHDQMELLTQRQKELLSATKEAKVKGDREKALHFLRQYKGVEQMVVAASNGLPVDLSQLPPSPYADLSQTKPSPTVLSHLRPAQEGDNETFERIKKQLQVQIDLCTSNAKLYEEIKNVGTATQYQNMRRELQQQLLAIEGIQSQGLAPPKFTMETRKFTIVHTHTHLSAQQCEVEVVKATAIPKPEGYEDKDLNVYVEIEFPWPSDDPPKMCTECVRGNASPEFNHTERFDIERRHVRSIMRVLKRTPLKCGLWQKRTLRKHIFIGQAVLQLEKLETRSEVRLTVDLLDEKARKPVGGKMELVARLREPLSGRDAEEKEEQWLVFQEAIAVTSSVKMPRPAPSGPAPSANLASLSPVKIDATTSIEALKIELNLVQNAIKKGHKDPATLQKGRQIQARLQVIRQRLQSDPQFRAMYSRQVTKEMQLEQTLEARLANEGKNRQAKVRGRERGEGAWPAPK
jgi:coiled-coil and C2 domain-containing protein 1